MLDGSLPSLWPLYMPSGVGQTAPGACEMDIALSHSALCHILVISPLFFLLPGGMAPSEGRALNWFEVAKGNQKDFRLSCQD